jgi:hypothetical protein
VIRSEIRQQGHNAIDGKIFTSHAERNAFQTLANLVKIVTFQPYTINNFQCLDRRLFYLLEKKFYGELPLDSDDSAAVFIRRVFHNMKKTLMPCNTRSALARIRVPYSVGVDPYFGIFDEFVLPGSQAFLPFG